MIRIENLSFSFPQKDLYNDISFTLNPGDHCAFIGTSGSGKSTLAEMIMDNEKYLYDGKIEIDHSCRIGHITQFYLHDKGDKTTVFEYMAEVFITLENKLAEICTNMETASDLEPLLEEYQTTLDQIEAVGGDDYTNTIEKSLNLANLMHIKDLPLCDLSGGEFKLIQIIREMLRMPELIIMDEPDVFLDFENLNSLKALINSFKGMLLVITHNRYLLNNCFNKIIHLENKELQEFEGTYVDYNFSLLLTKIELQELALADEEEIERNEILIDRLRFIASYNSEASRGKALKARVKINERLQNRRVHSPFVSINKPQIMLSTQNPADDDVAMSLKNLSISFDDVLLEDVSFEISAKDKVAIIGPNGTGKTTLLREIFNNSNPAITISENISMAYLSQKQNEMLNESNTILDEFFEIGFKKNQDIIDYIANYGFNEEYAHQKIGSLSGGEKNVLQLAKISYSDANLLLLDEPTSHLDTYSQIALEEAIANYNGGILMVSHDFYTIANCADYVILIEDKTIRKTSMRKFRKMIYAKHFDKDYLEFEQKKKDLETRIQQCLELKNFESAKKISEELEILIDSVK
ncbi:MAG: ABC-F family ATP-binding cassette domain-containing protein [Anaerovoracaceae bacterium]